MVATNLGLNGNPVKFLGAYVKSVSSNLGLSSSPSTCSITLVEDPDFDVFFIPPEMGSFHTIEVGETWKFSGVIIRYERDVSNISGRTIKVTMNDARQIMKSIPCILAPGAEAIAERIKDTGCSIIDVYGAFLQASDGSSFNLSGYNSAGMTYDRVLSALNGENITYGDFLLPVQQQLGNAFGETYRFDLSEISDVVEVDYRINTNLVPLTNIIEDIGTKHAFDWYIESEKAQDNIVDVRVRIIDRSEDSNSLGLQEFLDNHECKVISATSGIELRNEVSCLALQGAHIENLKKFDILGLANEPVDLTTESGTNAYFMNEVEMRIVLAGKQPWQIWLGLPEEMGGGEGASRYGGYIDNTWSEPIVQAVFLYNMFDANKNLPKNDLRNAAYLASDRYENMGKVYDKLKAHADAVYGKRWVHTPVLDEIIESAWTRSAVGVEGQEDPNVYFRQDDGRTRAYVEFSNENAGLGFDLPNATNLFGDQDIFRNVTVFGRTFSNVSEAEQAILPVDLSLSTLAFSPATMTIDTDKSNYTYDNANIPITQVDGETQIAVGNIRSKLWVAATVEKDGVVKIDSPVMEPAGDPYQLLIAVLAAGAAVNKAVKKNKEKQNEPLLKELQAALKQRADVLAAAGFNLSSSAFEAVGTIERKILDLSKLLANNEDVGGEDNEDADGNVVSEIKKKYRQLVQYVGTSYFKITGRCYQPRFVYIPTRSRTVRYGPIFSQELGPDSQGRVEIIQDDGFAPWEFGGISTMINAMQIKVDRATSLQKNVFSANISVEGFPIANIGDSLELNANINSINITFGGSVKTSYGLQTFTRKFGEFSKEEIARLTLYGTSSASRVFAQNTTGFNEKHRFGVNKNFARGGGGSSAEPGGAKGFA